MRREVLVMGLFGGLIAFSIACGSSSGADQDASTADDPGVLFDSTGDGAGSDVAKDDGPPRECETDEDCVEKRGEGFACNCLGECMEPPDLETANGCFRDINCGSEMFCESCTKTCQPLLPTCARCEYDEQCEGMMSRCVDQVKFAGQEFTLPNKICAPWCPLSTRVCVVADAPVGAYDCAELDDPSNGVCVPVSLSCGDVQKTCTSDADCTDNPKYKKCFPTLRRCGCEDVLACAFGEACHPVTRMCVPGCTDDTECGVGKVCTAGLCLDACTGSLEDGNVSGCDDPPPIADKQWDCINGHCRIPGMCFSPQDCEEKETYCDALTKECVPGCLIDYDCKQAAKECDTAAKTCIDRGCTGNWFCGCGQICSKETHFCVTAEGKYCEPCVQKQQESDPEPCEDPDIMCIGFQDPDTNEDLGSFCMPPCDPDPENECPQGWQCQEIKDGNGKSYGKKCIRACYKKVAGGCAMGDAPDPEVPAE